MSEHWFLFMFLITSIVKKQYLKHFKCLNVVYKVLFILSKQNKTTYSTNNNS